MYKVMLKVNGKDVPLTSFPGLIIANLLVAILDSLKDVDVVEDAVFELKSE
jgi:hypothetical protein